MYPLAWPCIQLLKAIHILKSDGLRQFSKTKLFGANLSALITTSQYCQIHVANTPVNGLIIVMFLLTNAALSSNVTAINVTWPCNWMQYNSYCRLPYVCVWTQAVTSLVKSTLSDSKCTASPMSLRLVCPVTLLHRHTHFALSAFALDLLSVDYAVEGASVKSIA